MGGCLLGRLVLVALAASIPARLAPAQGTASGIAVGDTVTVGTIQGWVLARVLGVAGNAYRVVIIGGPEVTKVYPAELRRRGPLTAYDRANGIYELRDKVQVLVDGRWIESEVVAITGMEYQVRLPGNRVGWTGPANLKLVSAADVAKPAAPAAGQPPRPGLTRCAGKIEGRYAATNGTPYAMTIREGKARLQVIMMPDEEVECWMGEGRLFLRVPGEAEDLVVEINDDGTLQTPFGEMRRRGAAR